MGQIFNMILILFFTVIMALLTSTFAYLFDELMTISVLKLVFNFLTDFIVVGWNETFMPCYTILPINTYYITDTLFCAC